MSIVALISDLGTRDHYVSLVKAALLNNNPTIIPVDISHEVGSGEIGEAAFLFRSVWNSFPFGTVFMNGVSSYKLSNREHIIIEYQDRFLITADNGVFSLMFPEVSLEDLKIYRLNIEGEETYGSQCREFLLLPQLAYLKGICLRNGARGCKNWRE